MLSGLEAAERYRRWWNDHAGELGETIGRAVEPVADADEIVFVGIRDSMKDLRSTLVGLLHRDAACGATLRKVLELDAMDIVTGVLVELGFSAEEYTAATRAQRVAIVEGTIEYLREREDRTRDLAADLGATRRELERMRSE